MVLLQFSRHLQVSLLTVLKAWIHCQLTDGGVTCRRALSSSSVDGVCAMLNHACTILEQDFREVLFSKLRQGFPSGFDLTQAYNYVQSTFSQGRIQSADVETDKSRAAFLVSLL